MRTIISHAQHILQSGGDFCLATILRTWGSAPRKAGAHMLITQQEIMGSVSGGCVENDVALQANALLLDGGMRILHYGVSDDAAWTVGLSCGGEIDILLETFYSRSEEDKRYWDSIAASIENESGAVIIHPLTDQISRTVFQPGMINSNSDITQLADQVYMQRAHKHAEVAGSPVFIEVVPPRHVLLIFGAAHLAVEVVKLARQFEFYTIVIDPRAFFTEGTTFDTQPDKLISAWPAEVLRDMPLTPFTYAITLSHDPKIDDQALQILLKSPVAYIGALGSKKTHARRIDRLQSAGFGEVEIGRIHAPVGIDIRAQSASEIALSIVAELVSEKNKYVRQ